MPEIQISTTPLTNHQLTWKNLLELTMASGLSLEDPVAIWLLLEAPRIDPGSLAPTTLFKARVVEFLDEVVVGDPACGEAVGLDSDEVSVDVMLPVKCIVASVLQFTVESW